MRYDLKAEQVFDQEIINDFAAHLAKTVSKGSAQHRKPHPRRIAKRVNSTYGPPFKLSSISDGSVVQSYTDVEVEKIGQWADYGFYAHDCPLQAD